jgi:hypothetical protein
MKVSAKRAAGAGVMQDLQITIRIPGAAVDVARLISISD